MDFTDSGELYAIQQAFYTGEFERVVDTDIDAFSAGARLKAQVLVARAQLILGNLTAVKTLDKSVVDFAAIKAYATYLSSGSTKSLDDIVAQNSTNSTVQYMGGLMLIRENRFDEALVLLEQHESSLEAVSLIVEVYLRTDKVSEAVKIVQNAKSWAQDNIVYNLAEAWVNLRAGGSDRLQNSYYIFEELTTGTPTLKSLKGQMVAQLLIGRLPEAQEAIHQAGLLAPEDGDVATARLVQQILDGQDYSEAQASLAALSHPAAADLRAKAELFDQVTAKYVRA